MGHIGKECAVPMCSNISSKTKNITYFSFPTNEAIRKVWAKLVSRREKNGDLWMPSPNSRVCNLHFLESDFRYWATYRRLLPNAIPTVFPGYPPRILERHARIIANFRKTNPLGVETTGKPSTASKRPAMKSEWINEDTPALDQEDAENDSYQSSAISKNISEKSKPAKNSGLKSKEIDKLKQRLSTEDSKVPKNHHSEESKPFKKRRIETDEQCSGDNILEYTLSTEESKLSKNQSASISEESEKPKPDKNIHSLEDGTVGQRLRKQSVRTADDSVESEQVVNIQRQKHQEDDTLGRGRRMKKRSVKLEFDSEDSKTADNSQIDEDYIPDQISNKRPVKNAPYSIWNQRLDDENNGSEESLNIRKIKRLEQQIKWKDERLFTLNQKAVSERNARLKAENELEILRNSIKNNAVVRHGESNEIPTSSRKSDILSKGSDEDGPQVQSQENLISNKDSRESNWAMTFKTLKQEITLKDQRFTDLKKDADFERNYYVKILSKFKSKNRFTQTVKQILEDSMNGDAKALFLLEQLEAYDKVDVTHFRMSTIKKCVEWKLMNARGYESVRNMGILTLPSSKILRDHVDVLADTGVTAVEEISLDSDLAEVMEEIAEEELPLNSMKVHSNKNNFGKKKNADEDELNRDTAEELLEITGATRQQVKRELPSSSSIEDDQMAKTWFEMKGRNTPTKGKRQRVAAADDVVKEHSPEVVHHIIGEPRAPFRMKLPSGVLIEEIQSKDGNSGEKVGKATPTNVDATMDHDGSEKLANKTIEENTDKGESNFEVAHPMNERNSSVLKVETLQKNVVMMEQDPTSENLIQDADLDDVMEPASEDFIPDGNSAEADNEILEEEVLTEPASEDLMEPVSEDITEPSSEDIVESAYENTMEPVSEGSNKPDADSLEVKYDISEGDGYIEEVGSSDEDDMDSS